MKIDNPDNEYNPFIKTVLTESEWNDIMITYCIYGPDYKQELLEKLKDQDVPIPHWGFK